MRSLPETRYATRGDINIAYQIVGTGPRDLLQVSPWFSNIEARWDLPEWEYLFNRFAQFSRFISFDKYGMGLSDPAPPDSLPSLEAWADDVQTVMDAVGSKEAALLGVADGGMMALLFAATRPHRVKSLILLNATARMSWAPDYPIGLSHDRQDAILASVDQAWGRPEVVSQINPRVGPAAQQAWARQVRLAASPGMGRAIWRMLLSVDVRSVLASVQAPTLVVTTYSPLRGRSGITRQKQIGAPPIKMERRL